MNYRINTKSAQDYDGDFVLSQAQYDALMSNTKMMGNDEYSFVETTDEATSDSCDWDYREFFNLDENDEPREITAEMTTAAEKRVSAIFPNDPEAVDICMNIDGATAEHFDWLLTAPEADIINWVADCRR